MKTIDCRMRELRHKILLKLYLIGIEIPVIEKITEEMALRYFEWRQG